MPKLRTHKGTQKRFDITGTGKLMRRHRGKSHLRTNKSDRVLRSYDKKIEVSSKDTIRIKELLPYGV